MERKPLDTLVPTPIKLIEVRSLSFGDEDTASVIQNPIGQKEMVTRNKDLFHENEEACPVPENLERSQFPCGCSPCSRIHLQAHPIFR